MAEEEKTKTKIYLTCFPGGFKEGDVIGYAMAEDGNCICSHLSSGITWSKHDLGLTSNWKHEHYDKDYPDGYELIWIDDPANDERWKKAEELNKARHKSDEQP